MPADAGSDSPSIPRSHGAGDVIGGKYRLMRLLGEGGMGAVWLAHNESLDNDVAIKLLRADLDSDTAGDRLLVEARAAAKLGHPNIVRVFDLGHTDEGAPYIVMELLDGESLASALERRWRVSATRAVQLLLPIADALSVAHGKNIVHRDLKPENIFLANTSARSLQPKLVDFGIAKVDQKLSVSKLTREGTVLGSPEYMAPEQARGSADIDHRADVWAFSIVLYEVVSGIVPFKGENYNAVMMSIIEDDPNPTTNLGAGDEALWNVIRRGMEKNPADRFQSMHEFGVALARWAHGVGVRDDVCGTSLESTWFPEEASSFDGALPLSSRTPEEDRLSSPRFSRPDSWLSQHDAAPSSVDAATVNVAPPASAATMMDVPLADEVAPAGPAPRRSRTIVLVGALVLVLCGAIAAVVVSFSGSDADMGSPQPAREPAAAAIEKPRAPAQSPAVSPRPEETESPRPPASVADAPVVVPTTAPPRPRPVPKPAAKPTVPKPRPAEKLVPKSGEDLKDPYE